MSNKIPTIFKPSGVSFYQGEINKLKKGEILTLEQDNNNKYDKFAIKVLNEEKKMCGFVPRKMKVNMSKTNGVEEVEVELNKLLHKKFDRIQTKYNLKVYEIYKWDGPTGYEVIFEKKTTE